MAFETIGLRYVVQDASKGLSDLDKLEKGERDLAKASDDAASKTSGLGKSVAGTAIGFAAAEVGLRALKGAFSFAIGNAVQFEHQIDQVGAVAQATDSEVGQLSDTAKQLGADTAFSANEAAAAMEELAAGGRSVAQIVGGEALAAVSLAAAGNYGLADSARTIATSMNVWEGTTISTTDVVNRLAGAANTSRFGVDDMSAAIAQGGGVAASAGVSFQDFSTAIAATASSFSSGSDAGTSFKTFITALTGNSEKAKDTIKELGLEFYTAQGALKPMSEIVNELNTKLSGLSQEQQTVALKTIFGNDAFRTAAGLMKMTGEEFAAMSKKMGDTDAQEIARQRMDNLSGGLEQLRGSLETIGISIGERVIPLLTDMAAGATTAVNAFGALPASAQSSVLALTAIAVATPAVIAGLRAAKDAVDALRTAQMGAGAANYTMVAGFGALIVGGYQLAKFFDSLNENRGAQQFQGNLKDIAAQATALGISMTPAQVALEALRLQIGRTADTFQESTTRMLTGTGEWIEVTESGAAQAAASMSKGTKAYEDNKKAVQDLGEALQTGKANFSDYNAAHNMLAGDLQVLFDKTVGYDDLLKKFNLEWASGTEFVTNYEKAAIAAASGIDATGGSSAKAKTPLDLFNDSLKEGDDRADKFAKALDALDSRFAEFNPVVIEAKGKLAAIDEELADLARSGGTWSETLGMTKTQLEAEKKALEDTVTAAEENQTATKGMRQELQTYIGEGLINLKGHLATTIKDLEGQENAEILVGKALRALNHDDIPGFIDALSTVDKAAPGTADLVVKALGPDLAAKLQGHEAELRASGSGLGTALADGMLNSMQLKGHEIINTAAGIVSETVKQMAAAAKVESPSKLTYEIGEDIVAGLNLGMKDGRLDTFKAMQYVMSGMDEAWDAAVQGFGRDTEDDIRVWRNVLQEGLVKGKELTGNELTAMFDYASHLINGGFGIVAPQMLYGWDHAFDDLRQSIIRGGGAANEDLIKIFNQMLSAAHAFGPDLDKAIRLADTGMMGNGASVPYLGDDGAWHLPGSGVPGASTIPSVPSGFHDVNGQLFQNGREPGQWLGSLFGMLGSGSGWVGADPVAMMASQIPSPSALVPGVGGTQTTQSSQSTSVVIDLSGATMTGTSGENETVIRRAVTDALRDVSGRDAFTYGVKVVI